MSLCEDHFIFSLRGEANEKTTEDNPDFVLSVSFWFAQNKIITVVSIICDK